MGQYVDHYYDTETHGIEVTAYVSSSYEDISAYIEDFHVTRHCGEVEPNDVAEKILEKYEEDIICSIIDEAYTEGYMYWR